MKLDLDGRAALVTGAASGIGRATAVALGEAGASVVLSDIDEGEGERALAAVEARGAQASFVRADVSRSEDVQAAVRSARERFGGLDIAFNNAGIEGPIESTVETEEEDFDRVIAVNLRSVWLCMRAEIPLMLERGAGSIVNCSSVAALVGVPGFSAYCATKGGICAMTRATALEYASSGIRVNSVCPGAVATAMIERVAADRPELAEGTEASEPIGRIGRPEEIAAAVVWLASDASSFVTGEELVVDGGMVAQ